jgi:hypothetical protein
MFSVLAHCVSRLIYTNAAINSQQPMNPLQMICTLMMQKVEAYLVEVMVNQHGCEMLVLDPVIFVQQWLLI